MEEGLALNWGEGGITPPGRVEGQGCMKRNVKTSSLKDLMTADEVQIEIFPNFWLHGWGSRS